MTADQKIWLLAKGMSDQKGFTSRELPILFEDQ